MPDYQLSKIYAIRGGDEGKVYIGSTTQKYLSSRYAGHKRKYKCFKNGKAFSLTSFIPLTSFILFDKYGVKNCFIELIEAFPCNSVEELHKREGEHIRKAQNCVNRCVAGRTRAEWREEFKEQNKEKKKKYSEINKEAIKEKSKKYYRANKEQINEKEKVLYTCVCGSELRLSDKARHEKSKKHIAFTNQNTIVE